MITKIPIESLTSDIVKQMMIHDTEYQLKLAVGVKKVYRYDSTDNLPVLYYVEEGKDLYSIHAVNTDVVRSETIKEVEPKPVPPVPPVPPTPVEVESDSYDYIRDEESWNESYENGALKKYYEKYPSEDLWNPVEHRAANFNDKVFEGTAYNDPEGEAVIGPIELQAQWYTDSVQKMIDRATNEEYFMPINPELNQMYELFEDADMTVSSGIYVILSSFSYPDCIHCWEGAVKAPGAAYPWIAPHFEEDIEAKVRFEYEGLDPVMPWGDKIFTNGSWGCANVSTEFENPSFKIAECGGNDTFNIDKFKMILIIE